MQIDRAYDIKTGVVHHRLIQWVGRGQGRAGLQMIFEVPEDADRKTQAFYIRQHREMLRNHIADAQQESMP